MLDHKKGEVNPNQGAFVFQAIPPKALRAVHVAANDAAREQGIGIIPRFRVPKSSVIYRVFEQQLPSGEAVENLSAWVSSDGTQLAPCAVRVKAKSIGDSVHALIVPIENR